MSKKAKAEKTKKISVKPGETVLRLSHRIKIPVTKIRELNKLRLHQALPGQVEVPIEAITEEEETVEG